MFSCIVK